MKATIKYFILISIFLQCSINTTTQSQSSVDSALFIPMFTMEYSFQVPGGDIADRYGSNSTIGGSFKIKTASNLMFGVRGQFMFGGTVKDSSMFHNIFPSDGYFVNMYGELASVVVNERGFYFGGEFGKLFPIKSINMNSGILVKGSVGLLQYKTRIENDGNNVPQLFDDYKKGYDRLTNGLSVSEFVGFAYFGKSQIANFYFGLEFYQAWTQSRRSFNFDDLAQDKTKRSDYLYSFKFGWIIPLFKRIVEDQFFYY